MTLLPGLVTNRVETFSYAPLLFVLGDERRPLVRND